MWTRKSLKEKAKKAFKLNYWKCVLCALIFAIFVGGATGGFSGASTGSAGSAMSNVFNDRAEEVQEIDHEAELDVDVEERDGEMVIIDEEGNEVPEGGAIAAGIAFIAVMFVLMGIVILIATAVGLVVEAFLIKPIEYGLRFFFRRNLDEPANLSLIAHSFDKNYMNSVKAGFFSQLFISLWSLLFVIPGIIKSYEYRLVPYLVSENTEMTWKEALAESTRLMKGHKWNTFVLDLSFIGWEILSFFTCGLLSIFYVDPYKLSTDAALYEAIKYGNTEVAA
ncbi:MAG: DUF975 family protein [Saccharofermentans sp.]|nr:DUF975 family protein [Saccharofermentans sp.]